MNAVAITLLATTLSLSATLPAYASDDHRNLRLLGRMDRQHERIEHGIESGRLTHKETRVLRKQQRKIHRLARKFRKDGRLSADERHILSGKLNKAGKHIGRLKHNDEYRYARRHRRYDLCSDRGHGFSSWRDDDEHWPRYGFAGW